MSSNASLAAARRRRGPQQQVVQANSAQRQQSNVSAPTGKGGAANINQYLVFLNNKIETVEKRVSESLTKMENKINDEIKKLNAVDLTLIEQTIESHKLKVSKLNSLISDLQRNYLALNTSLLTIKNEVNPISSYTRLEDNLTKVSIKEEDEEDEEDEIASTNDNNKETEENQLSQEPEPPAEIAMEEQNITHEILEKT